MTEKNELRTCEIRIEALGEDIHYYCGKPAGRVFMVLGRERYVCHEHGNDVVNAGIHSEVKQYGTMCEPCADHHHDLCNRDYCVCIKEGGHHGFV